MMKVKNAKRTKKCVIERKLTFEDYQNYLEVTQLRNEIKHLEKVKLRQILSKKIINNS